jgi:Ca2+-binding RTX toxin-like protein
VAFVVQNGNMIWVGKFDEEPIEESEEEFESVSFTSTYSTLPGSFGSTTRPAIYSDGRVVLAQRPSAGALSLVRFTADGTLEAGYPVGAAPTLNGDSGGSLNSIDLLSDGGLVASGFRYELGDTTWSKIGYGLNSWAYSTLVFATSSGMPDTRFGADGRVSLPAAYALGAAVQGDGSIVQIVDAEGAGSGVVRICGVSSCDGIDATSVRKGTSAGEEIFGTYLRETIDARGGDDEVTGSSGADEMRGGRGADRLHGGADTDWLRGQRGADRLWGDNGPDLLHGNDGNDILRGGSGLDRIVGGKGKDRMFGGPGNDRIFARDGRRDVIRCGEGRDRVSADRFDVVDDDCERVSLPKGRNR